MKIITTITLLVVCATCATTATATTPPPPPPPYTEGWYTQDLDHFDFAPQNTGGVSSFRQRYLYNAEFYTPGGPVLLYTGNEGSIVSFWNNTAAPFLYAKSRGGFVLFVEHRYFGESLPFGKNSFDGDALRFCSSQQALADYADVLGSISRKELFSSFARLDSAPVIAFGGSYGGMLAGWFRIKYPALVAGALAASAPIREFVGLVDPNYYNEIITRDYAEAKEGCADLIRDVYNQLLPKYTSSAKGRAMLTDALKTCKPLNSAADVEAVYAWSSNAFSYMAMLDYPSPADFLRPMPANPVNASCDAALASISSLSDASDFEILSGFAQAAGVYWNGTGEVDCFDLDAPLSPNLGNMIPWDWLACSEMVFPIAQTGTTDMFWPLPFNLTAYTQACQAQFGITPRPYWSNTYYGSSDLSAASNIIFSNGVLDPWLSGGVTTPQSPSITTLVIEHAAHHLDLRWPNPADPESVIAARAKEFAVMDSWLSAHKQQHTDL